MINDLNRPAPEIASAQLQSLAKACWQYDEQPGEPPQLSVSDIPMPSLAAYPNGEWEEARRRAMKMIGLKRKPKSELSAIIQDLATAGQRAPKKRYRKTLPAAITPDEALKAHIFILCDDTSATKFLWIYAIEWTLALYSQIASDSTSDIKHPIAPLIRAAQASISSPLVSMQPNRATNGIIPSTMHSARAFGYLPDIPTHPSPMPGPQQPSLLPDFNAPPSLLLPIDMIYSPAHADQPIMSRGKAAPLPKRIFFELLTAIPKEGRNMQGMWQMECTLRDFKDWLYPPTASGKTNFQMNRHLDLIRHALSVVGNIRMQRTLPGAKAPTDWLPIAVRALPIADLDSPVVLDIRLPPGNSGGALIDRNAMRHYGRISALQYSAALGFAYYWDKYATQNGNRILSTKPKIAKNSQGHAIDSKGEIILNSQNHPITGYSDSRLVFLNDNNQPTIGKTLTERRAAAARERNWPAIKRIPSLANSDILALCYPEEIASLTHSPYRSHKLSRAKDAITKMQADGHCIIEPEETPSGETRWRILPETPPALTQYE